MKKVFGCCAKPPKEQPPVNMRRASNQIKGSKPSSSMFSAESKEELFVETTFRGSTPGPKSPQAHIHVTADPIVQSNLMLTIPTQNAVTSSKIIKDSMMSKRSNKDGFEGLEEREKELWNYPLNSSIVYLNSNQSEENLFSFHIDKDQLFDESALSFVTLGPQYTRKQTSKEVHLNLILNPMVSTEQLESISTIVSAFPKNHKSMVVLCETATSTPDPIDIKCKARCFDLAIMNHAFAKMRLFDSIIFNGVDLSEQEFAQLLDYCRNFLTLSDLARVQFLLPPQFSLQALSAFLKTLFYKHLQGQKLSSIKAFLNFQVTLLNNSTELAAILVRANLDKSQLLSMSELSCQLLSISLDQSNWSVHAKMVNSFLGELTIQNYCKFYRMLHKEGNNKAQCLKMFHLFTNQELFMIETGHHLRTTCHDSSHTLWQEHEQVMMMEVLNQHHGVKNVRKSFNSAKEWDDSLEGRDIKIVRMSRSNMSDLSFPIAQEVEDDISDKPIEVEDLIFGGNSSQIVRESGRIR